MKLDGLEIPIAHSVYRVEIDESLAETTGHAGECHWQSKTIKLEASLKGEELLETLLHEIRHAHHDETGLAEILHGQTAELDCQSFAKLVTALMPILTGLKLHSRPSKRASS